MRPGPRPAGRFSRGTKEPQVSQNGLVTSRPPRDVRANASGRRIRCRPLLHLTPQRHLRLIVISRRLNRRQIKKQVLGADFGRAQVAGGATVRPRPPRHDFATVILLGTSRCAIPPTGSVPLIGITLKSSRGATRSR